MVMRAFDRSLGFSPAVRWVAAAVLAMCCAAPAWAQPVRADVDAVGFEAATGAGLHAVRYGQWFPILVQLTADGSSPYDVELRCEQEDIDGDRVAYVTRGVVANPGSPRRVWCYAVALMKGAGARTTLDVIGDDGALISSTPVPDVEPIPNDTLMILDISAKTVTPLGSLNTSFGKDEGERPLGSRFYRPICVASLPAADLPDRWWGLEAADVIVWDEPDPGLLRDPAQLPALIEWVRNGGQLVIGVGPAWSKIQKSELAEIMPIVGDGPPAVTRSLDTLTRRFGRTGAYSFKSPVSVALGKPAPDAIVTLKDRLSDNRVVNLISMRCVGSGRVIAVATRLRDLRELNWTGPGDSFARQLIDLNPHETAFRDNLIDAGWAPGFQSLYEPIISQIEFRRLASARVVAAFAFVAAYILLATFGAWAWLKRHTLTQMSWTVFAGFAVVASAVSLGAVALSRGVTGAVHTYSVVDLQADSSQARATTYFGYKSNRRQRVNLSLPGEHNYLRPLATGPRLSGLDYSTPDRYVAVPNAAALEDTLMRATLKQFEGFWRGEIEDDIGGPLKIRGELSASRKTGQVNPTSWVQNDLDVDIIGGYLLYIDPRLRAVGGAPSRVAGLNKRTDRGDVGGKFLGSDKIPPAVNVLVAPIPRMAPGQRARELWTRGYDEVAAKLEKWRGSSKPDPKTEPVLPTLHHLQVETWARSFGVIGSGVDPADAAALLASTRNLFLHGRQPTDFDSVGAPINTTGLVDLDITHWLTRGQAVLLLMSDKPGPAKLTINDDPDRVKVSEGRTIYRVRIPIKYTGRPPTGTTE